MNYNPHNDFDMDRSPPPEIRRENSSTTLSSMQFTPFLREGLQNQDVHSFLYLSTSICDSPESCNRAKEILEEMISNGSTVFNKFEQLMRIFELFPAALTVFVIRILDPRYDIQKDTVSTGTGMYSCYELRCKWSDSVCQRVLFRIW